MVGYTAVEAWQFVHLGRRLRAETQRMDSITLLDYFESRYADNSGLIRITGAVIIVVFITAYVAAQFNAGAKSLSAALREMLHALDPAHLDPFSLGAGAVIGFVGIGLGSPGQPHMVIRYMSIKDPAHLRYSAVLGTCWNILLGLGAVSIGLMGRMLVPDPELLPDRDPEMIYLVLSSGYFGPVLYGLLLGGVFAAILSTADSQLSEGR